MNVESVINKTLDEFTKLKVGNNSDWMKSYKKRAHTSYINELNYVTKVVSEGATILEYGSAPFVFTKSLEHLGYHVIGTDINPFRFDNFEKLNLDVVQVNYDNEPLPIDSNSIDVIICNEVFEHMRGNLIFTFEEAYRVLKPSGTIHIATPNLKSLMGIYKFLFKGVCYSCASDIYHEWSKIEKIGHMGHVREYTANEVSTFLNQIGFEINSVQFEGLSIRQKSIKGHISNLCMNAIPSLRPSLRIVAKKA